MKDCVTEGCSKPSFARQLCGKHYRYLRLSDDFVAMRRGPVPKVGCNVEGCDRKFYGRGYCHMHYRRWKNNGDPLIRQATGEGPCSYSNAHARVRRVNGWADDFSCVDCDAPAREWSYDKKDPDHMFNDRGHAYSYKPEHYVPRCKRCHSLFDGGGRKPRANAA